MTPRPTSLLLLTACFAACSTTDDPQCRPCERDGCPELFECALISGNDGVCVQVGQNLASCNIDAGFDAGAADAAQDAGPDTGPDAGIDAGVDAGAPDAGPDIRCPSTAQPPLTWAYSAVADLCFTLGEVTAEQFDECVNQGCTSEFTYREFSTGVNPECHLGSAFGTSAMNCVRADGAADFCTFVGGRLPTRAEWELEATNNNARIYPWGDESPDCTLAVFDDGSPNRCADGPEPPCTVPAGNSVSGLCDMAGNVAEITSDLSNGDAITLGGHHRSPAADLRNSVGYTLPGNNGQTGFRCVKAPL